MICRRGLPFLGSTSSSWMPFRLSWMLSSSEPCNNPPEREEPCSPRSYFFFFLAFFVAFFFPFAPHFPQDIFSSSYSLVQGSYPYSSRCIQPHPSAIANERGALVETHQRLIEMHSWHKCLFTWGIVGETVEENRSRTHLHVHAFLRSGMHLQRFYRPAIHMLLRSQRLDTCPKATNHVN